MLSAIGVEKSANHFFTRCVRPIGLAGELRHGSPLSVGVDAPVAESVTFPQVSPEGKPLFCLFSSLRRHLVAAMQTFVEFIVGFFQRRR